MARDPLDVLARVRDAAVTRARDALAQAQARERLQAARLDVHCGLMRREQAGAGQDEGGMEHVAAFAAWLPHARERMAGIKAALAGEAAAVAVLRQALADRRIEAEAVAKARARRDAAGQLVAARREQAVMDEAAGRSGRFSGHSRHDAG